MTERDDLIGKTLGQYQIIEEIGRGGMATVYSARQSSINRVVAIKLLPPNLLHDPSFYDRFEREVDVIARLEHPHILPIYDFGKAEGMPYIVMRYLKGGSMRDLIRRGLPNLESIEKPFTQVAQALDYAHQQGIIHRDLKPGNVMLDENGNAYLSDFGIARVLGSDLTGSAIIGTPAYMSPEQANGLPLDARSDIYALGVVLFELITGREPYQAETPMALLLKHISEPMPPASRFRDDVSPSIEAVILRATAKNPDDRYASAGDMARAYRDAIHDQARPTPLITPTLDDDPTIIPANNPTPAPMRAARQTGTQQYANATQAPQATATIERRGIPVMAIVGGVVALAVLIGAAIFLSRPAEPVADMPATFAALARMTPTPFPSSQRIEHPRYSISIPQDWIPPQGFFDITREGAELIHVWQPSDMTSYVGLTLIDAGLTADSDLAQAVEELDSDRWNESFEFVDESTAPDGTIRRSHRVIGPVDPPFPNGQTDTFYFNRAPYLVILDLYSADSTANTRVSMFQQILDSLRIKGTL
jgi:serine/threonine protein kinase